MKRIICVTLSVVLCMALVCPVLAAEDGFVSSISYKDAPTVVPVQNPDGGDAIAVIQNSENKVEDYIDDTMLVLTPVSQAETSSLIPDHAEQNLLDVYDKLSDGSLKLPYEKFDKNLKQEEMVIRDLFDVSWLSSDKSDHVSQKDVHVKIVFDLGIAEGVEVYCMTYKNNEWNPIVSTKNIGGGKVECVFEDFCPVAFAVQQNVPPAQTGDTVSPSLPIWIGVMVISAGALVALLLFKRKKAA